MMLDLKNLNRFQAWLIIYQHKSMVYRESKISIPEKHHPSARLVAVFLPELVTDYWYQCKVSYGYQSMELISLWSVVSRELQGTISWVSIIDDKIPMVGHSMDTPSLFMKLFSGSSASGHFRSLHGIGFTRKDQLLSSEPLIPPWSLVSFTFYWLGGFVRPGIS